MATKTMIEIRRDRAWARLSGGGRKGDRRWRVGEEGLVREGASVKGRERLVGGGMVEEEGGREAREEFFGVGVAEEGLVREGASVGG